MRRRVFLWWFIGLSLFWLYANLPYSVTLVNFIEVAGFPCRYAFWIGGELRQFDIVALSIDLAIALVTTIGLSALCAWSRKVPAKTDCDNAN
jgi:hypothetical protein